MPIVVILEFQDAVSKYDRALELMPELADQPGRSSHVCAPFEDGFLVVEIWESADAFEHYRRMLDPLLAEVGLVGTQRLLDVHRSISST